MYSPGTLACILFIFLVSASGCSVLSTTPKPAVKQGIAGEQSLIETPTLPEQYVAQPLGTPKTALTGVATPTFQENFPLISPAQMETINGTGLAGNATNASSDNNTFIAPVAQFTSNVSMGFAPLTVQFGDTSSNLPTAWTWDFGDAARSSFQNPSHTYYNGSKYTVNLIACNDAGCSLQTSADYVSVFAPGFSVVPNAGLAPLTVSFTDTGTGSPPPSSWHWDFGDGITGTMQNTTHQYVLPGVYDVKFRISSPAGTSWVNRSGAVTVT